MRNKYIESFEKAQLENRNIPEFRAGDTVEQPLELKKVLKQEYKTMKDFASLLEVKVQVVHLQ